ncbi:hypothetical protein SASPL_138829 [Salvia splendens]|uniref:Pentatricopeptide repeat domain-containing protein 1 n=2 Tax=Salvia splendens TaxID=180675 RepID=A0A8X8WVW2_SALSN|nr:hypothetical protein SASPL_138829 [Salvia splendens]
MRGLCRHRAAIGGGASGRLHITTRNVVVFWERSSIYKRKNTTSASAISNLQGSSLLRSGFSKIRPAEYNSIIKRTSSSSIYDYNVRLGELSRRGNVKGARKFFDEMPERDKVSYASMISIYLKHDEFHKAESLYFEIPEGMRSIVADSAMVDAYAKAGRMNRAKEVFDKMPERNAFSWTSLISGYFELGEVDDAVQLFGRMPDREKNVVTWTSVIAGFARNGLVDEARDAFDRMPLRNAVAWTLMIKAYVEIDRIDEAFSLFRVMPEQNLYAWSIMISGLLNVNRVDEAKELFDSMPWRNAISWTTMVTGLARNGMTELAREYFNQMLNKDVAAWNAMITAYAEEGRMEEARELFNMMSKRDIITWNTMIGGYSKGRHEEEAFRHFDLMLQSGIRPNESSVTNLLTSCGGMMGVVQAHGLIARLGFEMLTPVANALITMYHRSGDVISAQIAFQNLDAKDVVTWTAIIVAYSNHGYGIQALQAFAQMLRLGHSPDVVTFVGVLSACSHAGFVKKGRMLFDSMKRGYGLEPTPEHYSCLVDILGRAGLVKEAVKVVEEMPPDKCDSVVLQSLIGGCRLLGADGVADHIGDELIELDPACSGGYVLLANLYAATGKWDKFAQLRKKMKEREVSKVPGFSQIEVNGKTHVFLVRDGAHPELKEIYKFLDEKLTPEVKDFGYEIAILSAFSTQSNSL